MSPFFVLLKLRIGKKIVKSYCNVDWETFDIHTIIIFCYDVFWILDLLRYKIQNTKFSWTTTYWKFSICCLLTNVREHWFLESRRHILTIVFVETIFTMWRNDLELELVFKQILFVEKSFLNKQDCNIQYTMDEKVYQLKGCGPLRLALMAVMVKGLLQY